MSEIPQLVVPGLGYTGLSARWRLVLESPARLRVLATDAEVETTELYVGRTSALMGPITIFAGSPAAPGTPVERFEYPTDAGFNAPRASIVLLRRAGVPRAFDAVGAGRQ